MASLVCACATKSLACIHFMRPNALTTSGGSTNTMQRCLLDFLCLQRLLFFQLVRSLAFLFRHVHKHTQATVSVPRLALPARTGRTLASSNCCLRFILTIRLRSSSIFRADSARTANKI